MGKFSAPDSGHHFLKIWPVGVFCGISCIFKYNVVVDAEHQLAIGDQLTLLHLQGVFIDLPVRGDSDVDCSFQVRYFFGRGWNGSHGVHPFLFRIEADRRDSARFLLLS